jgi:RimJ/RimL family protein N-acetyltransferase
MIRPIPNINTARLSLGGMRPEDFNRFAEIWAMPEVVRYIGLPRSRDEAWNAFLRNAGHWQMTGFGQWAIQQHSDRQMIGQTGFFYGARGLGEDFDRFPEAGWILTPDAHGRGLGTEAVRAAHEWFDRVIAGPLVAIMSADNKPSRRLADYFGYRLMRHSSYEGKEILLLRRDGPPTAR